MVSSCNHIDLKGPICEQMQDKNMGLLSDICRYGKGNKELVSKLEKGLWMVVGNGQRTYFWEDL